MARDLTRSSSAIQSSLRGTSDRAMVGKLVVGPELSRGNPTSTRVESDKSGVQPWEAGARMPRQSSNGSLLPDGTTRSFPPMPPRWTEAPPSPYNGPMASPYNGPMASPYNGPVASPYNGPMGSPYNGPVSSPYNGPMPPPYGATGGGWSGARYGGSGELAPVGTAPGGSLEGGSGPRTQGGSGDFYGLQSEHMARNGGSGEQSEFVQNPIWPTNRDRSSGSAPQVQSPIEKADGAEWANGHGGRTYKRSNSYVYQNAANPVSGAGEVSGGFGAASNGPRPAVDSNGRQGSPPDLDHNHSGNGSWQTSNGGQQQYTRQMSEPNGRPDVAQSHPAQRTEGLGAAGREHMGPSAASSSPAVEASVNGNSAQEAYSRAPQNGVVPEHASGQWAGAGEGVNGTANGHAHGGQGEGGKGGGSNTSEGVYGAGASGGGDGAVSRSAYGWQGGSDFPDKQNGVARGWSGERAESLAGRLGSGGNLQLQRSSSAERLDVGGSGRAFLKEKSYSDSVLQTQGLPSSKPRSPPLEEAATGPSQLSPPATPSQVGTTGFSQRSPSPMRSATTAKPEGYDWPTFGIVSRSDAPQRLDSSQRGGTTQPRPQHMNGSPQAADSIMPPAGSSIAVLRNMRAISPSPRSQAPSPVAAASPQLPTASPNPPSSTSQAAAAATPSAPGALPGVAGDKEPALVASPSSLDNGGPLPRRQSDMQSLRSSVQALQVTVQGVVATVQQLAHVQQLQAQIAQAPGPANLQEAMAKLGDGLQASIAELTALVKHKDEQQQARLFNLTSTCEDDPLVPLPTDQGSIPGSFPASRKDFADLTPEATLKLAQEYGLPLEPSEDRLQRLGRFVGLRVTKAKANALASE